MLTKTRVLFWIGLLCFVPFFFLTIQHNSIPNGTEDKFTLGLPQSPWLIISSTETKAESKDGVSYTSGFKRNQSIEFLSWSWLFAIGGWAIFALRRRVNAKSHLMAQQA